MSGYFHRLAQRSLGGMEASAGSGARDSVPHPDALSIERDEVAEHPAAGAGRPVSPVRDESDREPPRAVATDEEAVPFRAAGGEAFRAPGARLAEPSRSHTLAAPSPPPNPLVPPYTVATRSPAVRAAEPPPAPISRDDGAPRRDSNGPAAQREGLRDGLSATRPAPAARRRGVEAESDALPAGDVDVQRSGAAAGRVEVHIGTVSVEIHQTGRKPAAHSAAPVQAPAPPAPRRERFSPSRHYLRLG